MYLGQAFCFLLLFPSFLTRNIFNSGLFLMYFGSRFLLSFLSFFLSFFLCFLSVSFAPFVCYFIFILSRVFLLRLFLLAIFVLEYIWAELFSVFLTHIICIVFLCVFFLSGLSYVCLVCVIRFVLLLVILSGDEFLLLLMTQFPST